MLPAKKREDLKASILKAQTVTELEAHFERLIALLKDQSVPLLSDLWAIVDLARERITTIRSLKDLGNGDDQNEQSPRAKIGNWFGQLCEILARYDSHVIAANLLIELWNQIGEHQSAIYQKDKKPRHLYRAGISMYLGRNIGSKRAWSRYLVVVTCSCR